jgi:nucleoside-diphosphate-sugar epimerase
MKVFVAGATGVLGRALVPQLVARGHEVVGMTRSASKQIWCAVWERARS